MKADAIRDMTRDEVIQKKNEIEEEIFNLRLKKKTKQAHNPVRVRLLHRDLARILTIIAEDERGTRKLAEGGQLILDKKE
jgi:large subunit ribosomal protein L29